MTIPHTLILITVNPNQPIAWHAYRYAKSFLELQRDLNDSEKLSIFFYGEGAYTANKLRWQTADIENITQKWVELSQQYSQTLPVCVSTALTRGVTDDDNAKRHSLEAVNIADGFELVGLGELATKLSEVDKVVSF